MKGLSGAVIEVIPAIPTERHTYYTSVENGHVTVPVKYGDYTLEISFMGFKTARVKVSVSSARSTIRDVVLQEDAKSIGAVVKSVKQIQTTQNADTLVYNASAFKVAADADVEGLIKKMPGIEVNEGTVEAQGEKVRKVFVDGEEFFGDDPSMAIKTLPADAVDKIEIFDKLSDEAEFSGVDDGESYRAMNIVTRKHARNGTFGKVYGGLGYQQNVDNVSFNPKYIASGNINIFRQKRRVSLIGLFNNLNQQNFSLEDLVGVSSSQTGRGGGNESSQFMVRPEKGVALVNAIGFNYNDRYGRRGKVRLQASYFFNNTITKNHSLTQTWLEDPSPYGTRFSDGFSRTINDNHRFNAKLNWDIARNQSFMSRTALSFQGHRPETSTLGYTNGDTSLETSLLSAFQGLSYINSSSRRYMNGLRFSEFMQYRLRLGKPGRTLSFDGRIELKNNHSNTRSASNEAKKVPYYDEQYDELYNEYFVEGDWEDMYSNPRLYSPLYQYLTSPTRNMVVRTGFSYFEPLAQHLRLHAQYHFSWRNQEKTRDAFYCQDDTYSEDGRVINPTQTFSRKSDLFSHRAGIGLNYNKNKNNLTANVFFQSSNLQADIVRQNGDKINRTFNNVLYQLNARFSINSEHTLRVRVRSSVDSPSVGELENIIDVANTQSISVGNPDLKPAIDYSANIRYMYTGAEKGISLMYMLEAAYSQRGITTSTLYNPDGWRLPEHFADMDIPKDREGRPYSPNTVSSYENTSGGWNLSTRITYGMPLTAIKCNFNVSVGVRYTTHPAAIYSLGADQKTMLSNIENHIFQTNMARNLGYTFRATLSSNISEKVDFTIFWRGGYNKAWNALQTSQQKNTYFSHTASADIKVVLPRQFTITASAQYSQYVGFTTKYNEDFLLCNAFIGKKVCKNHRGEIMVGVNDIFNQNKSFQRTTGSGYTRNLTNSVIGRCFLVQFVYSPRSFKSPVGKKESPLHGRRGEF